MRRSGKMVTSELAGAQLGEFREAMGARGRKVTRPH